MLDKLIRDSQYGQTMGIPIGPDVSLLVAELLLSRIDQELVNKTAVKGLRYFDDYELTFETLADAERGRAVLQELLGNYELTLNEAKTSIKELPFPLQESWISELSAFSLRHNPKAEQTDMLRYFDKAFALAAAFPSEGVLRYAIGKAANLSIWRENRILFQDLLLHSATAEPGCLPIVLKVLCKFKAHEDAAMTDRTQAEKTASILRERMERYLASKGAKAAIPRSSKKEKDCWRSP